MSATLTGQVAGPDGYPVVDAVVTVTDAAGGQVARSSVDEAGGFWVPVDGVGPYTVVVVAADHQPAARSAPSDGPTDHGTIELQRVEARRLPQPGRWVIDPVHSTISVTATHLGVARVGGRFAEFRGHVDVRDPVETSAVEVRVDAASIDTGNHDRDEHLRSIDFLDVKSFPDLEYRSTAVRALGNDHWELRGELTLRGQTRPLTLATRYHGTGPDPWGGTRAGLSATGRVARDDFDITWGQGPLGVLGVIAVGRHLDIALDIQLVLES